MPVAKNLKAIEYNSMMNVDDGEPALPALGDYKPSIGMLAISGAPAPAAIVANVALGLDIAGGVWQ